MFFTDTHAHIYAEQFDGDRDEILEKALEKGVREIFMPNIDATTIEGMLELEEKYPDRCYSMMGLHPCSVGKDFEKQLYQVEDWLSKRKFVAVGEMGTDLYWDKTYWREQQEAFKIQVNLAKKHDLPIVIHCRNSISETLPLLESLNDEKLKGVVHCFTGTVEEAKQIIALKDFYLGVGGVATFKKGGLDKVLPEVPLEHLVLETDSPYLSPTPYRGKRNEPGYIPMIAEKLAEIKKETLEKIKKKTTENAFQLFQLPSNS